MTFARAAIIGLLFLFGAIWFGGVKGAAAADAPGADSNAKPPSAAAIAFDRFLAASSPVCSNEPSEHCFDIGWRYADANKDGYLSLAEVQAVRAAIQDWLSWKWQDLPPKDRTNVTLGLLVADMVGLDKLFAGLNTAGNGKLSRAELLADVKLDSRPLGPVLQDPNAVDRPALAKRLGRVSPLVQGMIDGGTAPDKAATPP